MSIVITAYKNRSSEHTLTVTDSAGAVAAFQVGLDVTRLKIGIAGAAPLLDLDNVAPIPATSHLTPRENPCTLVLTQADLNDITPGIYELEVAIVDDSDSDRIKHADKGIFVLHGTQLGDVALT